VLSRFRWSLLLLVAVLWPATAWAAPSDAFTQALAKGPVYAALAALLGGLAVSLTPCVYPMVAVTVSIFGAKQAQSRSEGMLLSLSFVLGIAAMLVPLGVIVGMGGGMFGAVLQSRAVIVGISLLFVIMAASMFGAFELTLPEGVMQRLSSVGGVG
jgi:thioredoxin:protein disulfide reductase